MTLRHPIQPFSPFSLQDILKKKKKFSKRQLSAISTAIFTILSTGYFEKKAKILKTSAPQKPVKPFSPFSLQDILKKKKKFSKRQLYRQHKSNSLHSLYRIFFFWVEEPYSYWLFGRNDQPLQHTATHCSTLQHTAALQLLALWQK